jgi:phage major head subunit gpT-like protein
MKKLFFVLMLSLVAVMPIFASSAPAAQHYSVWSLLLGPLGMVAVGMVLSPANIAGLYTTWKTIFNQAMAAAVPQYEKVAMVVPSTGKKNGYAWLGAWPKMREWIGDREFHKLEAFNYEIDNKKWESSISIPEEDIEDDIWQVYEPLAKALGVVAKMHPDDLVFDLIGNAFTLKGYDGKSFFATDHKSGTNKGTAALSFAAGGSYAAAKAALGRVKDSQGKPLFSGGERDILIVPPELEEAGRTGLNADFISVSSGSTQNNPWKNSADLIVCPRMVSATAWIIARPFAGLMPFIYQPRRLVRFVTKNDPQQSDYTFLTGKYAFGADCRDNAGYGLHQLAYGSTGAGS